MLANLRHTLSPAVLEVYKVVNAEFAERLHDGYASKNLDNYLQHEDLIKITTLLLDHE
jgi:GTP-binding protein EngB required for normal cell division